VTNYSAKSNSSSDSNESESNYPTPITPFTNP